MPSIDYECAVCHKVQTVTTPFSEKVLPTRACECGAVAYRIWSSPQVQVKGSPEKITGPEIPLPGER